MLLSACAYISTGRKPALNSGVCVTVRCAFIKIAASMYACARVVSTCSIKGRGQMLAYAIILINAFCPAQRGVYFLISVRIERRHSDFD